MATALVRGLKIKEKILDLKLQNTENLEYMSFLNNTKFILKNDLDEIEKKKLKTNIDDLKKIKNILKKEINILRKKNEKIKKE